jgi:hypothetical protein
LLSEAFCEWLWHQNGTILEIEDEAAEETASCSDCDWPDGRIDHPVSLTALAISSTAVVVTNTSWRWVRRFLLGLRRVRHS